MNRNRQHKNPIPPVKGMPDFVQISSTNICNFDCGMCPRKLYNLTQGALRLSQYKIIVDKLPASVKRMNLTGWGEPLLNPSLWDMVSYAKKKGFVASVCTNASLLNRKNRADLLDSNLDFLSISLEGVTSKNNCRLAHPYSQDVINNIREMLKLRGNNPKPYISLEVVLLKGKEENVFEIVKFASETGIDSVYFSKLNTAFRKSLERHYLKEEMTLWHRCLRLKNNGKLKILVTPLLYLGLSDDFQANGFCPKIYNYVYIDLDGSVTPCCNLPHYKIGNIFHEELKAIWMSNKFREFRRNQKMACSNICNQYSYSRA